MPDVMGALQRPIGPLAAWQWGVVIGGGYLGYRVLTGKSVFPSGDTSSQGGGLGQDASGSTFLPTIPMPPTPPATTGVPTGSGGAGTGTGSSGGSSGSGSGSGAGAGAGAGASEGGVSIPTGETPTPIGPSLSGNPPITTFVTAPVTTAANVVRSPSHHTGTSITTTLPYVKNPGGSITVPFGGWGSKANQVAHAHPPARTRPSATVVPFGGFGSATEQKAHHHPPAKTSRKPTVVRNGGWGTAANQVAHHKAPPKHRTAQATVVRNGGWGTAASQQTHHHPPARTTKTTHTVIKPTHPRVIPM